MNHSPTNAIGSHAMRMPMPSVMTMNKRQREIQRTPNQNVRICHRKCDSSHVPRVSLRFT